MPVNRRKRFIEVIRGAPAILALFLSAAGPATAQTFRVATWQVPDIQIPRQTNATPTAELARLQSIADALSPIEADAIILYGLSDGQALKRISDSIKSKKYSVAIHSVFRHGGSKGPVVGQPFGVLTRRERMSAKNFDWADTGRIDMPGGFAFATLRHGSGAVCIYVASLPGSLSNGLSSTDGTYLARKRNYAAEFLSHHASWIATTYTNQPFAIYMTGDINLAPKKPVRDDCAAILEKAGFRAVPVGSSQDKTTLSITNGMAYNRVFDPVFTRTVEFVATRQVPRSAPEEPIVVCEITLRNSGSAAVTPLRKTAPASPADPPAPQPVPAPPAPAAAVSVPPRQPEPTRAVPVVPNESAPPSPSPVVPASGLSEISGHWLWPATGLAGFALLALGVAGFRRNRSRSISTALSRRTSDAVYVEMNSPLPGKPTLQPGGQAMLAEPVTATDNSHNALWQAPEVHLESGRPPAPTPEAHAGLMPHLRRLMREKLFIWLSAQRSHLINSHEAGTEKVLGLEERLEKIQDQFQDRLIAQQQRIAELDRELQAKEKFIKESLKEKNQNGNSQAGA